MKRTVRLMSIAAAVAAMTACSSADVFDAGSVEQKQMADYAENFVKKYGEISPNQTWDFSTGEERLTRAATTEITTELVDGLDFGIDETVDGSTLKSTITKNLPIYNGVSLQLPDGRRHTGESALLVAPSSSFYIYPISAQGQWTHDLYVKVGDAEPVLLYSKDWTDYTKPYVNGMATVSTVKDGEATVTKRASMPGMKVHAPIGTTIEIIMYIYENKTQKPTASTLYGSAIVVDAGGAKPEGVPMADDAIIQYVGLEDRFDYDFDYNDAVLAIVGDPDAPATVLLDQENYDVKTYVSKRYLIEDLGTTDDFDFNDVVVDVTKTTTTRHRINSVDGVKVSDVVLSTSTAQQAVVRHLGGTLPFTLKIGYTTLNEMGGEETFDTDTEQKFTVNGWNPDANNVSVTVRDQKSGTVYNIGFPKQGEAPMIIAVDPDQGWMPERQSIPASWFTTK